MAGPAATAGRPDRRGYVIGFYNLENLFDTVHDEGKNDAEFLPDGGNHWTPARYERKIHNMARVIRAMADENKAFHTILGVSEIENRHVLEDLVCDPQIVAADYQIVHYDGPDRRGVDVALLYRPDQFKLLESRSIPFTFDSPKIDFSAWTREQKENFKTRDILMVRGTLAGEMFAFLVGHFPSRIGGKGQDLRPRAAEIMYEEALRLMKAYPGIKIAAMGDMNDDPTDPSMTEFMHGRETLAEVGAHDFFSPFFSMLKAGYGSLAYRGVWNIFDLILVNKSLTEGEGLRIVPLVKNRYYGRIFKPPFLIQQDGPYKGTPFRTFSGGSFLGGYSDHFPTYIVVARRSEASPHQGTARRRSDGE